MTILYNHRGGLVYSCRFKMKVKHPTRSYERETKTMTWQIPEDLQFKFNVPPGKEKKKLSSEDVKDKLKRLPAFELAKAAAVAEFEKEVLGQIKKKGPHDSNTPFIKFMEYHVEQFEFEIENEVSDCKSESHVSKFRDTLELAKEYLGPTLRMKDLSAEIFQDMFDRLRVKDIAPTKAIANVDLKALLKAKGFTLAKFCADIGISDSTFRSAAKGNRIELEIAKLLAKGFEKPLKDLFDIEKDKQRRYKKSSLNKTRLVFHRILAIAKKRKLISENYASTECLDWDYKQ